MGQWTIVSVNVFFYFFVNQIKIMFSSYDLVKIIIYIKNGFSYIFQSFNSNWNNVFKYSGITLVYLSECISVSNSQEQSEHSV